MDKIIIFDVMVKIFQKILLLLWRIWFYILVTLPILVFFPLLFVFSISERWYPQFFWVARNLWANTIIYGMGLIPIVKKVEVLEKGKSYMLVANHTSMLDIMLMLKCSKNPFVFVGKKELSKLPIFGYFYKRVCILVDRESAKSRTGVYLRAQRRLKQGVSICIFPEGGVPDESLMMDTFKDGAFNLAIAHKIPVVPMTFMDNKKRFPFTFFKGSLGKMRVFMHEFVSTTSLVAEDKTMLKDKVRAIILEPLERG